MQEEIVRKCKGKIRGISGNRDGWWKVFELEYIV